MDLQIRMSNIPRHPIDAFGSFTVFRTHSDSLASRPADRRNPWWSAALCALTFSSMCNVHAQERAPAGPAANATPSRCLPDDSGYLRARLKGSIDTELDWGNASTECIRAVRPTDGGIRMRFKRQLDSDGKAGEPLVLVFGIAGYLLKKCNYPLAPLVLAIVLGDKAEESFRQSLLVSQGGLGVFFSNPLVSTIMVLGLVALFWPVLSKAWDRLRAPRTAS